jgi:hypothetical protein
MRRTIPAALKFLGVAVVLYLLCFGALAKLRVRGAPLIYRTSDYYQWKGGVAHAKFTEWDPARRWDAVVIGSSHAYRGYDPRVFQERGYDVFNLGSTAQTPLSSYVVLKHHVQRSNTRLVIFDLYENAMDQDGMESVSDLSQNMPTDAAALELTADLRDLRGINMFTLRMMTRSDTAVYNDPNYKGRGFAVKPDSIRGPIRYDVGRPLRLHARQLQRFADCLDLCRERGIPVVLVSHFYPHQSDRKRHIAFVQAIDSITAGRGLTYFDLTYAHDLSDTDHFCDHNHLNEAGVRIFTDRLIDSLEVHQQLRRR